MAADQPTVYRVPPRPVFRKLFKQGQQFICGICRSRFTNRVDANNCLNFCWFELKSMPQVIRFPDQARGWRYRCQYCARDYAEEEAAKTCAQSCVEKHNEIHVHEQLWNDLPLADQRPVPIILVPQNVFVERLKKPEKKPAAQRSKKARKLKAKPYQEPILAVAKPKATPQTISIVDPGPAVLKLSTAVDDIDLLVHHASQTKTAGPGENVRNPAENFEFMDQYSRLWLPNPLGYRCAVCQTIHEDEPDAENCFHSHFDAKGRRLPVESDFDLDN